MRASGFVRPGAIWLANGVAHPVERVRQRIRGVIPAARRRPLGGGVMLALAVGDLAAIDGFG
jgi:hypothetical protein